MGAYSAFGFIFWSNQSFRDLQTLVAGDGSSPQFSKTQLATKPSELLQSCGLPWPGHPCAQHPGLLSATGRRKIWLFVTEQLKKMDFYEVHHSICSLNQRQAAHLGDDVL